jgi:hypothetical protein
MSATSRGSWFIRSYLKKAFCPNLFAGAAFQLLDILEYACGLQRGPALNLNQNPIFEMASITQIHGKFSKNQGVLNLSQNYGSRSMARHLPI